MKHSLYKDMTDKEKIGLLHFIRGQQGLVQHANYEGTRENPKQTPNVSNLYISAVLDINFDNFYGDRTVFELSKIYEKQWQVEAMDIGGSPSPFIGDAMKDIPFLMLDIEDNLTINEDLMKDIDKAIIKLYKTFYDVAYNPAKQTSSPLQVYQYIDAGVTLDGKTLYKRVYNE